MRILFPLLILLFPLISGCSQETHNISKIENGLRTEWRGPASKKMNLIDRMAYYSVPGVSIAMVDENKIAWVKAYGLIEKGKSDSVSTATLFQSGSTGKAIMATAALQLVEKGSLSLDTSAKLYLKSWKIPENSFTRRTAVTLRQLLSHTAGVNLPGVIGYQAGEPLPNLIQILNGSPPANTPPIVVDRVPRTAYSYSSGGYMIVQQMIMDQYGDSDSFPEIIEKSVFKPAQMTASNFDFTPDTSKLEVACGHRASGKVVEGHWYRYPEMGMGVFWTTPSDMAKFIIQIMHAYNGLPNQLLSETLARNMLADHTDNQGLGLKTGDDGKDRFYFYHRGAVEGFQTFIIGYPLKGQGAVIMTNGDDGWPLIQEIIKSISIEYKWVGGIYL
jgi:CubicO group peptidase (beta-lactamase class C family)